MFQNLDILRGYKSEYVLILAGDHVYKMDYGEMLAFHCAHAADMTVACIEVPVEEASAFGVMTVDEHQRVVKFTEKPEDAGRDSRQARTCAGEHGHLRVQRGISV